MESRWNITVAKTMPRLFTEKHCYIYSINNAHLCAAFRYIYRWPALGCLLIEVELLFTVWLQWKTAVPIMRIGAIESWLYPVPSTFALLNAVFLPLTHKPVPNTLVSALLLVTSFFPWVYRAEYRFCEQVLCMLLQSNAVSHCLGAILESALHEKLFAGDDIMFTF